VERRVSEADWKLLRRLEPLALDRFCRGVLAEVARLAADAPGGSHARYLEVFRLIRERDGELAAAFDGTSRSAALAHLARLRELGVVTDEEFAGFSAEAREAVARMLGARPAGPGGAPDRGGIE
jgi:DNA-binding transcriptional ArsR family regulator